MQKPQVQLDEEVASIGPLYRDAVQAFEALFAAEERLHEIGGLPDVELGVLDLHADAARRALSRARARRI